ncbi:MAG: hypothetical protein IT374_04490 [Polyangiaceae bacterium]|nr:hypothetical protein [Polyangiaceae bacterium]
MEARRGRGERYSLSEALGVIVPLAVAAAQRHEGGGLVFLHPSSVLLEDGQPSISEDANRGIPNLPRDRACLAPEEKQGKPGNARASVYAIGAILYELVTGETVGPGMRRPTEIVPNLPAQLEAVLSKALVSDPAHRPDDLLALAQAMHHLAPSSSIAPPAADESHLDGDEDFEVDVRLSMMPPAEALPRISGPIGVPRDASSPRANDPTTRLAELKTRLESDPRPRYVVIAGGMDHGPFSAVELLQQVGTGQFVGDDGLRDAFSNEERPIKDWDEFAPFAEQAKLNKEIKQEKVELDRVVAEEKKGTAQKAVIGGAVLAAVTAVALLVFLKSRGTRDDTVTVQGDRAVSVDIDGGVKASKTAAVGVGGPGGRLPTQGAFPMLPGGMSCEGAQAKYVEEMKLGEKGAPDLTQGQFGAVLNNGSYLNSCGVPESTKVHVCAAVQNGRAVGVTVTMDPPNPGASSCVAGRVRGLSFPSHPKLDIARTTF